MKTSAPIRRVGIAAGLVLLAGIGGFFAGGAARSRQPSRDTPGQIAAEVSGRAVSRDAIPSSREKALALPEADFRDAQGFAAYVDQLETMGLGEKHARWLALRMKSGDDVSASFEIARAGGLLDVWASGAAEADPSAAFGLLEALPIAESRVAWPGFFSTLGRTNPQLGLEFASKLPSGSGYMPSFAFVQSWASVAPFQTVAEALKTLPEDTRKTMTYGLFKTWGRADRVEMLTWAQAQGPLWGTFAFRSLSDFPGVQNPEEILDLAVRFPSVTDWMALSSAVQQLAVSGVEGFNVIAKLPPGMMREGLVRRFAGSYAKRDPEAAWELMQTLPPEEQALFFKGALTGFSRLAPRKVAEALKANGRSDSYVVLIRQWAEQDAPEALGWTRNNLTGLALRDSLETIFTNWSKKAPASALVALSQFPPGQRARLLPSLAAAYGEADPQSALAWAGGLPPIDRIRGVNAVVEGWAQKDAVAAATALKSLPPAGLDSAFNSVAWSVARENPAYATTWAADLAEPGTRNRVISRVVGTWGAADASAASEYLQTLDGGDFRDHAVAGFVGSIRDLDPATAAAWANSIQTQDLKRNHLRGALLSWKENDPAAARRFAEGIESEPLRSEMLRELE